MESLNQFYQQYNVNYKEFNINTGNVIIDIKAAINEVSSNLPILALDIDYTVLDSSAFKEKLNKSFGKYFSYVSPTLWKDTYSLAKNRENYYDYEFHCEIIARKLDKTDEVSESKLKEIEDIYNECVEKSIPALVHRNIIELISNIKARYKLIFITSGSVKLQRLKIAALLPTLSQSPDTIIYTKHIFKGEVLCYLNNQDKFLNLNKPIHIIDDNVDELEDLYDHCNNMKIHLYRIKQINGLYNTKEIDSSLTKAIKEIDCIEHPQNLLKLKLY